MKYSTFSTYHPIINFTYFVAVLLFSMIFMHPVFQAISLVCAFVYSILLNGKRAVLFNCAYMLPLMVVMAILNPTFNHQGVTILFYLNNGNPITLESILYGIAMACMFITVIIWFSCYNAVMSSDKFIYLFGKIIPAWSLILSMSLRFVPRYRDQIKIISNAQKCIGRDISQGNLLQRARNGLTILSIMTTWALENAIETADSMKSRGYGLPNRTSFSIYRFDRRDQKVFISMLLLIVIVIFGAATGENSIRYFPSIKWSEMTSSSVMIYISYSLLCFIPVILHIAEEWKWNYIESRN
ncbi:energy-coupling factor transporter transmembrane component T [Paenibacillus endoradicis]|uniref:energy-coupling factor transporter transmembrane component T n=1 Tax=Paenibacillus endoradicis TaxID=2972487 RepID=UPI0021597B53|nr:energy-coupling factor transporter transmembrane component T [Paenibacillus endoradicis]MCR8657643.1 energy-coupling factor transporter transmembrane protein EcfT [Paenibacillus endoradicis]